MDRKNVRTKRVDATPLLFLLMLMMAYRREQNKKKEKLMMKPMAIRYWCDCLLIWELNLIVSETQTQRKRKRNK